MEVAWVLAALFETESVDAVTLAVDEERDKEDSIVPDSDTTDVEDLLTTDELETGVDVGVTCIAELVELFCP